jgi:UDP-glucuronate 4-epimerase
MRVLLTGAAGFIGSSVAEALLRRGDEVVGIDNFNSFYDPAVKEANVREVEAVARRPGSGRFSLLRADLVHDQPEVRRLFEDPATRPDAICLLELARDHGVRPFVFASSSSVYGARSTVPFSEEDRVDDPISPYAATKKAGELFGYTYAHLFGLNFIGLRFFTVYGPRQRPEMAIHLFARSLLEGRPIRMHGDGSSSRDYTYIDDCVRGVVASIDRATTTPGYRIYNLGGSETTSLAELVALLEKATGRAAVLDRHPDQPGDVPRTYADIARARAELGYDPKTPVSDGIPAFVAWLRRRLER